MYGYQEIITDPSYAGQMVCFTYPHIGNYGCTKLDMESDKIQAGGVIIKSLSIIPSNFRSEEDFATFLLRNDVMGICEVETRRLVQHIRDNGSKCGAMAVTDNEDDAKKLIEAAKEAAKDSDCDYISQVTCKKQYEWDELTWNLADNSYKKLSHNKMWSRPQVVVLDCGVKKSDLRLLLQVGFRVTVVPANYTVEQIMALTPDAIFVSSGPGNPQVYKDIQATIKELLGKLPMFGVALGHQLMALAGGAKVSKLKFGRHGGHSVNDVLLHTSEVLVHDNDYVVDPNSLPRGMKVSFKNLTDGGIEGLECPALKAYSIQFSTTGSPGPQGTESPFHKFFEVVVGYKNSNVS